METSCLSATLLAIDPKRTGLESIPSLGRERPAASRLRHSKFVSTGKVTIFICDILLCHDSITCVICVRQNTAIFRQQSLCVYKSRMFWPRTGHSQAHNNSKKTFFEEDNIYVVVYLNIVKHNRRLEVIYM